MTGKYAPLERYLLDLPPDRKQVRLDFARIEAILGSKLPSSAYEDERWWQHETEGNHRNTRAWSNAGWMIGDLDVRAGWVEFKRDQVS